jgi:ectoine hydroxylase-related dioxygenase (phytanoyl-CoA dioxygenase family)
MDLAQLKDDLDHFGFVVVNDLVSRTEAESTAAALLDNGVPHGGNDVVFGTLPEESWGPVVRMVTHPVAQELAEHALGPDLKMIGECGRLWAEPGQGLGGVHSDLPVSGWWRRATQPMPTNLPCLQTIWALTDFTAENGATQLIPFTHNSTHYPRSDYDYQQYLKTLEMPAGSFAAFNCRIWHQRGANRTNSDRVGLSIPYIAQWLDPVTTGWKIMPHELWQRLPESIQQLNPHTISVAANV